MKKMKVRFSAFKMDSLIDSAIWSSSVSCLGVGANLIYCSECRYWVNKNWTGVCGKLLEDEQTFLVWQVLWSSQIYWGTHLWFHDNGETLDVVVSPMYMILLVQVVSVDVVQIGELGMHGKSLGNYSHWRPIFISISKLVKRFSICVCNLSPRMLSSAEHRERRRNSKSKGMTR